MEVLSFHCQRQDATMLYVVLKRSLKALNLICWTLQKPWGMPWHNTFDLNDTCVWIFRCTFVFLRSEKSVLWFFGESARSLQLPGYSRLCRNSQLPRPDAGCWAFLPEALLRGGSARGVHAAQPDRGGEAYKMWWNPGRKTRRSELFEHLVSSVLWRLLGVLSLNIISRWYDGVAAGGVGFV